MTDIPEAGPPPRPMNTMRPVIDAMPGGFGSNPMSFFNMSSRPGFNPSRFRPGMDNTNGAPVLLGLGASLMVLSIALIAARMWSRARPTWRLKADDWTILAGLVGFPLLLLVLSKPPSNFGIGQRERENSRN